MRLGGAPDSGVAVRWADANAVCGRMAGAHADLEAVVRTAKAGR
jgi:hypothetical protein